MYNVANRSFSISSRSSGGVKIGENEINFIKNNYMEYTNMELAMTLQCALHQITYVLSQNNLRRPVRSIINSRKQDLVSAIEDCISGGMMMRESCKKWDLNKVTLSKYISKMIPKKLDETTEIITLKSKV